MEYLKYFENKTSAEGYKTESYFVGYLDEENKVLYSRGGEVIKDGEMVMDEPDPTAGFVDLGLSVMWASCDVGASSPEEEGTKYAWGQNSWDTIPLESDPVYKNSSMKLKDVLQPRTPSPEQIQELLDNTTAADEVLNGVSGVRYTASNGNSIFVSNEFRWTNATKYTTIENWSTYEAACWKPSVGIIENTDTYNAISGIKADYTMKEYSYLFRGVCNSLPSGGATLLYHGIKIKTSSSSSLYCFPKTWLATEFKAPTSGNVKLFLSTTPEFSASDDDPNVLTSYELELVNGARELFFSNVEMSVITALAVNDYIYVRFLSDESTALSINEWVISSCANNSRRMYPNVERSIAAKSYRKIYRLKYADFKGGAITITWTGNSTLPTFLAQDCNLDLSTSADNLLLNPAPAIARKGKLTIDAATVNSWASRIDEEGFMYVNFNPNNTGRVTFTTNKSEVEGTDDVNTNAVETILESSSDCGCANNI